MSASMLLPKTGLFRAISSIESLAHFLWILNLPRSGNCNNHVLDVVLLLQVRRQKLPKLKRSGKTSHMAPSYLSKFPRPLQRKLQSINFNLNQTFPDNAHFLGALFGVK